jgi:hypothetical protein
VDFTTAGLETFGFSTPVRFQEIQRRDVLGAERGASDIGGVYVVHRPRLDLAGSTEVVYIGKGSLVAPRRRGRQRGLCEAGRVHWLREGNPCGAPVGRW